MRPRFALLSAVLALWSSALAGTAFALPDLWKPDASHYGYLYAMDTSRGDPFAQPYNRSLNVAPPQKPQADHDPSHDFYLFEPKRLDGSAVTARPLVVYFHGADMSPNPTKQRAQIEHYVKTGYSVLWMPYCDARAQCLDFVRYDGNALQVLLDARFTLNQPGHVGLSVDGSGREQVMFIAHSLGSHVAARVAATLAAFNQGWGALPVPRALILHDGAGYTSSVKGALEDAGFGWLYQTAIDNIESHGWGWDDPDGGTRTYEIKDALPLPQDLIKFIPSDTLLMILGAKASVAFPNAYETTRRIFAYASSTTKRAYVVPHQCVSQWWGPAQYGCPSNLSSSSHGFAWHQYYSSHAMFAEGADSLKESGVILQTTACLKQAETGVTQAYCTGTKATYAGEWREGTTVRAADPKTVWTLTAP